MNIIGEWWNELGSKMVIARQEPNLRFFHSTYHTAVGTAQQRNCDSVGSFDVAGGQSQSLGWMRNVWRGLGGLQSRSTVWN